jgi:ribonucleotide monophosphatase NagD (HAD superfamily)
LYEKLYNQKFSWISYGKPNLNAYKFCESQLQSQISDLEISNFYMIGDNPSADIQGAKNANWKSILVKTGVYTPKEGQENDLDHPADFVVNDFTEAIDLIFEMEKIL